MAEAEGRIGAGLTFAVVLADPSVSFSAKSVMMAWRDRDWLDAAGDARLLAEVFETEAEGLLRGRTWPSR